VGSGTAVTARLSNSITPIQESSNCKVVTGESKYIVPELPEDQQRQGSARISWSSAKAVNELNIIPKSNETEVMGSALKEIEREDFPGQRLEKIYVSSPNGPEKKQVFALAPVTVMSEPYISSI